MKLHFILYGWCSECIWLDHNILTNCETTWWYLIQFNDHDFTHFLSFMSFTSLIPESVIWIVYGTHWISHRLNPARGHVLTRVAGCCCCSGWTGAWGLPLLSLLVAPGPVVAAESGAVLELDPGLLELLSAPAPPALPGPLWPGLLPGPSAGALPSLTRSAARRLDWECGNYETTPSFTSFLSRAHDNLGVVGGHLGTKLRQDQLSSTIHSPRLAGLWIS